MTGSTDSLAHAYPLAGVKKARGALSGGRAAASESDEVTEAEPSNTVEWAMFCRVAGMAWPNLAIEGGGHDQRRLGHGALECRVCGLTDVVGESTRGPHPAARSSCALVNASGLDVAGDVRIARSEVGQ